MVIIETHTAGVARSGGGRGGMWEIVFDGDGDSAEKDEAF